MMRIAIVAENLARPFGSVVALDGLSLEVESGTIFGLLGLNGAVRTTTIRLLLGLLEPTAGQATVLGHDTQTQAADIREKCGVLLDEPTAGLDPVAAVALRDDLSTLVAREGTTVFLTTHNLNESEKLCSRWE